MECYEPYKDKILMPQFKTNYSNMKEVVDKKLMLSIPLIHMQYQNCFKIR